MKKELSKNRSIRLTDSVMKEMNEIIEDNNIRSRNVLMEILIAAYKENKMLANKKKTKCSDSTEKENHLIRKDIKSMRKDIDSLLNKK